MQSVGEVDVQAMVGIVDSHIQPVKNDVEA